MKTKDDLKKALQALGVKGSVTIKIYDTFTVKVFINGKAFGIWDRIKKTFVD